MAQIIVPPDMGGFAIATVDDGVWSTLKDKEVRTLTIRAVADEMPGPNKKPTLALTGQWSSLTFATNGYFKYLHNTKTELHFEGRALVSKSRVETAGDYAPYTFGIPLPKGIDHVVIHKEDSKELKIEIERPQI